MPNNELNALYKGVAVRYVTEFSMIELKGNDVLDFIHRISTNAIKELKKEDAAYTVFTTEKGKLIDLTYLVNFDVYQMLFSSDVNKEKLIKWLNRYIISEDVTVKEAPSKYKLIEISGSRAEGFVSVICGNAIDNMPENSFRVFNVDGFMFFVIKNKFSSQKLKFNILVDSNYSGKLYEYLLSKNNIFEPVEISDEVYEEFRIENGIPKAGHEIIDIYNPYEAGLKDFLNTAKGCYIGQEVIARLETYDKVQKTLVGFVSNFGIPELPALLYDNDGNEVGRVTSITKSFRAEGYIGLAIVNKQNAVNDKELYLDTKKESKIVVKSLPVKR